MTSLPDLMRPSEVCEVLAISDEKLRQMLKAGDLRHTQIGPRTIRIWRESVSELLARGEKVCK